MAESVAERLLHWFDVHARDLPWRQTQDPYRIWLSEVMLQQTRVETVIPYFHRFLDRFPTVEALAAAKVEEVLALWSGLGYYRRARQMHAAAQTVAGDGAFPQTPEGLRALPGIGPYTAAAVGSIAFGWVEPVLDGNVERVLGRYLALTEDPKTSRGRKSLLAVAREMLDPARPGDSNQALMELGATLCSPAAPRCRDCPLRDGCAGWQKGDPEAYPRRRKRKKVQRVRLIALIVEREGRLLLFRRPEGATLLAGTWEIPWVEAAPRGEEDPVVPAAWAGRYGGRWQVGEALGEARHAITFRALTVRVYRGEVDRLGDGKAAEAEWGWFKESEIGALATSSLVGKILALRNGQR